MAAPYVILLPTLFYTSASDPPMTVLEPHCKHRHEGQMAGCRHAGLKSGQGMQNVTCSHRASGMRDPSPQKVREAHLMGVS